MLSMSSCGVPEGTVVVVDTEVVVAFGLYVVEHAPRSTTADTVNIEGSLLDFTVIKPLRKFLTSRRNQL